jgi:two-component sensor histidine kinase
MMSWLTSIKDYMPHGMCLLWQPGLMALHIISDATIALAYFVIPVGLLIFARNRKDLVFQHKGLAALFALFITACGFTHLFSIIVLWHPYYALEGVVKAVTAVASVGTAVALPLIIPQLLRIPSPKALSAEIAAHRSTLVELEEVRRKLAERVVISEGDLAETSRRFETAIEGSPIAVFEQDEHLVYTWVFNPHLDLGVDALLGNTEADLFDAEAAASLQALKQAALDLDQPSSAEIRVVHGAHIGWFAVRVKPIELRDGRRGLIATSSNITTLKQNERHLQILMRELNHRSNNMLTVVMSIARQTAKSFDLPRDFTSRLQQRLESLASAHDVLTKEDWRGADLHAILRGQLGPHLDTYGPRISVSGPSVAIRAEAVQYVGMALHELGSNAVKHGALSQDCGCVVIRWRVDADGRELVLEWIETAETPIGAPERTGFGAVILMRLVPEALAGSTTMTYPESGLRWTLRAPLPDDRDADLGGFAQATATPL